MSEGGSAKAALFRSPSWRRGPVRRMRAEGTPYAERSLRTDDRNAPSGRNARATQRTVGRNAPRVRNAPTGRNAVASAPQRTAGNARGTTSGIHERAASTRSATAAHGATAAREWKPAPSDRGARATAARGMAATHRATATHGASATHRAAPTRDGQRRGEWQRTDRSHARNGGAVGADIRPAAVVTPGTFTARWKRSIRGSKTRTPWVPRLTAGGRGPRQGRTSQRPPRRGVGADR
jgi:hypothetical protein